jgi:hypothetical protein
MTDINDFLYYNSDWKLTNTLATDSLGPFTSFKTANYELTDALLGQLTNDVILATGTRAFNASQSMGNNRMTNLSTPINDGDAATKLYVDNAVSGLNDFRESVLSKDITDPPGSPTTGDRYLIGLDPSAAIASGAWAGRDGDVAEWGGSAWSFENDTTPFTDGTFIYVEDIGNQYIFNTGTPDAFADGSWALYNAGVLQAGDGISIDNATNTASVDIVPNDGLEFIGGQITVDEANIIDNDTLRVDGSGDIAIQFASTAAPLVQRALPAIDLASNGNLQGAKILGFDPTNVAETTSPYIQGAIEDAFTLARNASPGYNLTAAVTVGRGDVVYVSNSDNVSLFPIQSPAGLHPIGLAQDPVSSGSTVKISKNNTKLLGVLSGATAGQQFFWNNLSGNHETTPPTTSGYAIIRTGFAANGNDLIVDMEFLRINA